MRRPSPAFSPGRDGKTSPRQSLEHNLSGTINLLEYCRDSSAGIILLSTSRVYSIPALAQLPLLVDGSRFITRPGSPALAGGNRAAGVAEAFSTEAPISLYGATKLASECLAQEYAAGFRPPVWINRCGVLAGAGHLAPRSRHLFLLAARACAAPQLEVSRLRRPRFQVRDALHPRDLARLVELQLRQPGNGGMQNVSGGQEISMSLAQLTAWCNERFGPHIPPPMGQTAPTMCRG